MFPETKSRETLRSSGNKIHCSPRDQSLSVKCFDASFLTSISVTTVNLRLGKLNFLNKLISETFCLLGFVKFEIKQ